MPTARELLDQADALMRRNRARDVEADIPELTDEVAVAARPSVVHESPIPSHAPAPPRLESEEEDDVPVLVDAVEELSIQPLPDDDDEVSRWLEVDMGKVSITGAAPDTLAVVPPSTANAAPPAPVQEAPPPSPPPPAPEPAAAPATASDAVFAKVSGALVGTPAELPAVSDPGFDAMLGSSPAEAAFEQELTPLNAASAAPATPATEELPAPPPVAEVAPSKVPDSDQWEGLAEEIRMQVLQRIDIFTDTGLQGELAARLQPIVDRASADLVTTINREVGQILRAYVAEAIEREIATWREGNP
jgi:hypothetical protein